MPRITKANVEMFALLFSFRFREHGSRFHAGTYSLSHPTLMPGGEEDFQTLREVFVRMNHLVAVRRLTSNAPFFSPTPRN